MLNERSLVDQLRANLEVANLRELSTAQRNDEMWDRVASAYVEWDGTVVAPPMKQFEGDNHIRPIIVTSAVSTFDEVVAAAKALLLCNSVVILLPDSINYIWRMLRLAVLLEKEIDAGLVILLPESVVARTRYFDKAMMQGLPVPNLSPEEKLIRAEQATKTLEIALALDVCAAFPNDVDLAFTDEYQKGALARLVITAGKPDTGILQSVDRLRFLPRLIGLPFPDMRIGVNELIAIRRDGLFSAWQAAVQRGLTTIEQLNEDDLFDPDAVKLTELRTALESASHEVSKEISKSSTLRKSFVKVSSFGVACAAGALGAMGGPILGGVAGGAALVGAGVVNWLGGRPTAGERSFRKLIVQLFESSKPPD
jgi:hypothetical protein